jgi:hypothetical protein
MQAFQLMSMTMGMANMMKLRLLQAKQKIRRLAVAGVAPENSAFGLTVVLAKVTDTGETLLLLCMLAKCD